METPEKEDTGGRHRTLLCQGPVELRSGRKRNKRHLSLFNVLVVSSNLNKKKFKIKCIVPLDYLWAMDDVDLVRTNKTSTCKSFFLFWPTGNFLATFRSKEQKDRWYYFLQRSINEAKKDMKKNFSLQIFTEDILTCDSPLCVTATNTDTVNDIVEKLLPMIRMTNIEDYQLWFCPAGEEAPRALQGYEYPHDILMTNLQNIFSRSNSRISTTFAALPDLFLKDLNSDAQGKFILKPRDSARSQQQNAKERPDKKRRLRITSCFHRGSVPHQDQVYSAPRVDKGGKLFGNELSSLCHEGKLPAAILDILALIKEKGPTTKGIFITPPNETSYETLKESLESGEEVDIKNQSVHVVAWILKEFLQTIKGSLLTSQLYDQWLAVPQEVNDKEKLGAVQSLLDKLPPTNAALLGHLFRILHEISRNCDVNQMQSYDLSVAIAPYIFFLPSYRNEVLANDVAEKISLVNFLITNSPKIFGLDFVPVSYKTSLFHPQESKASCSQNMPYNMETIKKTDHELSRCPSGWICTPDYYALLRSLFDDIIDCEKVEEDVRTTQHAPSQNLPEPVKTPLISKFPPIAFKDGELIATIHDMLATIAEKGHESDQIFAFFLEEAHWSLRDKVYTKGLINLKEESVLIVASVLKHIIINIQGSLLSEDLYSNWLSVLDEESLLGRISAIQSNLLKIPQANYTLLKHLISVLLKIKTSSRNRLDAYILSFRTAPNMLWDPTCRNSLFGRDVSEKITIVEIMIENCAKIFGDNIYEICPTT